MSHLNLIKLFELAHNDEREAAKTWYWRYHNITTRIAQNTEHSPVIAHAVFSALSPNNDYIGNLRDVRVLLESHRNGLGIDDFKVSTYGNNKRKAWRIANGACPFEEIVAPKTKNFFMNVYLPDSPDWVTVDGHMYWAWKGERGVVKSRSHLNEKTANVTRKTYELIAQGTIEAAASLGILPNQLQAIVWTVYRRMHNIRQTQQMELIPFDLVAAGLPTCAIV